jgi:hypothetical protein
MLLCPLTHYVHHLHALPQQAYVTDRAVRKGRANASSGRMMVTTPSDYFGPIGPEFDPERNQVRACLSVV